MTTGGLCASWGSGRPPPPRRPPTYSTGVITGASMNMRGSIRGSGAPVPFQARCSPGWEHPDAGVECHDLVRHRAENLAERSPAGRRQPTPDRGAMTAGLSSRVERLVRNSTAPGSYGTDPSKRGAVPTSTQGMPDPHASRRRTLADTRGLPRPAAALCHGRCLARLLISGPLRARPTRSGSASRASATGRSAVKRGLELRDGGVANFCWSSGARRGCHPMGRQQAPQGAGLTPAVSPGTQCVRRSYQPPASTEPQAQTNHHRPSGELDRRTTRADPAPSRGGACSGGTPC